MQKNETQALQHVEDVLADARPFGDCDYIHRCVWRYYERRLEMLQEHASWSGALSAALCGAGPERRYRVIGDAAVRHAIDTALGHYKLHISHSHPEELERVISGALPFVAENRSDAPLASCDPGATRLGRAPYHGWIHSGAFADNAASRSFMALWERRHRGLEPRKPTEREHFALQDGARLLDALLPRLARSALAHTHLIVVADYPGAHMSLSGSFNSMTTPNVFGVVILSPRVLKTAWSAAEHLLHESLHLKFMDIEQTHSMLRPGYRSTSSPIIQPAWHRVDPDGSSGWPVHRCLTVMHVYTALALFFFRAVEQRAVDLESTFGPLGALDPALEARRSFDRARFLGRELIRQEAELGAAGKRFIAWLMQTLDAESSRASYPLV